MDRKWVQLFAFLAIAIIFTILLFGLGGSLVPLIVSFALAYLLFPPVLQLEKRGVPRQAAVLAVFLVALSVMVGVGLLVAPRIFSDLKAFIGDLPNTVQSVVEKLDEIALNWNLNLPMGKEELTARVGEYVKQVSAGVLKDLGGGAETVFSGVLGWILGIMNLLLIPVFFFYLISDYERMRDGLFSFVPRQMQARVQRLLELADRVMSGYIRGQLVVVSFLAVIYSVGLSLVGLKYGFLIGLFAGFISLVPYLGLLLGLALSAWVGLATGAELGVFIGAALVFGIAQGLEGAIITPRYVGNRVGLSSLTTLLALIVGGNLMGLPGMLIAIPGAAVLKAILLELRDVNRRPQAKEPAKPSASLDPS